MPLVNRLRSQYKLIIDSWPIDPLRPTISFRETLAQRADAYFGSQAEPDAAIPAQNTSTPSPSPPAPSGVVAAGTAGAEGEGKQVFKFDAALIQKEINILGNLLEDRFKTAVGSPSPLFSLSLSRFFSNHGVDGGREKSLIWHCIVSAGRDDAAAKEQSRLLRQAAQGTRTGTAERVAAVQT